MLEGLKISGQIGIIKDLRIFFIVIHKAYLYLGQFKRSFYYTKRLYQISKMTNDYYGKIDALVGRGEIYIYMGEYKKAQKIIKRLDKYRRIYEHPTALSVKYLVSAMICLSEGNFDKAIHKRGRDIRAFN